MTKISEGIQFEYRLQRLFFHEGYFTRRGVDLYPDVAAGQKVTDVDVLALAFGPSLQPILLIGECKTSASGQEEMDRLTWLRGMVHFLKADAGFFAKTTLSPHIKGFARHLDLVALNASRIAQREQSLDIADQWIGSHDAEFMGSYLGQLRALAKQHPDVRRLSQFLYANFWWQDNFDRLKRVCSALSKTGELYDRAKESEHKFIMRGLYYEATVLLTVSLLYVAQQAVELAGQESQALIHRHLASGIGTPEDFEHLASIVEEFVREAIRAETGRYPTKPIPPLRLEAPPYAPAMIALVERLLQQSGVVRELVRFQDVLFYEYLHRDRAVDWTILSTMFPGSTEMLLKQTQNIMHFARRQLRAPASVTEEVLELSLTQTVGRTATQVAEKSEGQMPLFEGPAEQSDVELDEQADGESRENS
jgi:hypothetical protein